MKKIFTTILLLVPFFIFAQNEIFDHSFDKYNKYLYGKNLEYKGNKNIYTMNVSFDNTKGKTTYSIINFHSSNSFNLLKESKYIIYLEKDIILVNFDTNNLLKEFSYYKIKKIEEQDIEIYMEYIKKSDEYINRCSEHLSAVEINIYNNMVKTFFYEYGNDMPSYSKIIKDD